MLDIARGTATAAPTADLLRRNPFIVPACAIALANIVFLRNQPVSMLIVALEVGVLLFHLAKLKMEHYLCWLLIFLGTSIEFTAFVSNDPNEVIYGFKTTRFLGMNLGLLFVILPFAVAAADTLLLKRRPFRSPRLERMTILLFTMMTVAIVCGLLNLAWNDNGIRHMPGYAGAFLGELYLAAWPILLFGLVHYTLSRSRTKGRVLERGLFALVFAVCTVPLIPALAGVTGSYGDFGYMLTPSSAMLTPFVALLPAYRPYRAHAKLAAFLFVCGVVVPMVFFGYVNGKLILVLLAMPTVFGLIWWRNHPKARARAALALAGAALVAYVPLSMMWRSTGGLFEQKAKEAISVLTVWRPDYVATMGPSAQFRYFELVSVWEEYRSKPGQVVFGKGYMGSIRDHLGVFNVRSVSAFPLEQFDNGTFYSLHEVTGYLLKYGLLGLFVWFVVARAAWRHLGDNPWIVVGAYWYLLLIGYSLTLSVLGATALAYGFFLVDQHRSAGGSLARANAHRRAARVSPESPA